MRTACGLDCRNCPALARCGGICNFCLTGITPAGLEVPPSTRPVELNPLRRMDVRRAVADSLGGLDFTWPRPVRHPSLPPLPLHIPVLVQAYADPIDVPWVALHAGRVFGITGQRLTPKHRRPLRDVYRLAPTTRLALEFYVEDRVLEGVWASRGTIIESLRGSGFDLIIAPSFSVWFDDCRFSQVVQQKRAFIVYHELLEAGLPAIPDIGWSLFEPDGRLWGEWVNSQPDLKAVSLFCGTRKVHASRRALEESLEDIALFHGAVRPEVTFVLGGVHAPERLFLLRLAAPGRRLVMCNGMAYAMAQRRRLLGDQGEQVARSARDCFLLNSAHNDQLYAEILGREDQVAL